MANENFSKEQQDAFDMILKTSQPYLEARKLEWAATAPDEVFLLEMTKSLMKDCELLTNAVEKLMENRNANLQDV